jgi:hypothetical protein
VSNGPNHLSDGKFAPKSVADVPHEKNAAKRVRGRPFKAGNPGRPKGALNKTTRAVKEFLAELCDDERVQRAVRKRIYRGDTIAFFRALEHVVGKPTETQNVNLKAYIYEWGKDKR